MAKKKPQTESVPFEEALSKLEEIVRQLEDGQLGLSESLARYEEGVRYLKECHAALTAAEQKILLLTAVDETGRAVAHPFTSESSDSGAKSLTSARTGDINTEESDVDTQKGLF